MSGPSFESVWRGVSALTCACTTKHTLPLSPLYRKLKKWCSSSSKWYDGGPSASSAAVGNSSANTKFCGYEKRRIIKQDTLPLLWRIRPSCWISGSGWTGYVEILIDSLHYGALVRVEQEQYIRYIRWFEYAVHVWLMKEVSKNELEGLPWLLRFLLWHFPHQISELCIPLEGIHHTQRTQQLVIILAQVS